MNIPSGNEPVVVVGGGIAGLCCALHLQAAGVQAEVLEASSEVGGRVRTDRQEGFLLDRGFQVLLTGYPEVRATLDLEALELGRFVPGALIQRAGRFERLVDPFRAPRELPAALRARVGSLADKLRVARLRLRLAGVTDGEDTWTGRHRAEDVLAALQREGFSEEMIDAFFRPFFGGVFLDRELRASSAAFAFLFRTFARGDTGLPAGGMGEIPAQLARRLAPGSVRAGAAVSELRADGVRLGGEWRPARAVVLAAEARAAARLLPGLEVPPSNPSSCLYFAAPRPPAVGAHLVLDGEGQGPVNALCVPSNIAAGYAPEGQALVSASCLGEPPSDDGLFEQAARLQLGRWLGDEVASWRLLRIDRIRDALPRQTPGPTAPVPRPPRHASGVYLCGDYRDLAGMHGAMASGRRTAGAVSEALAAA